MTGGRPTEMGKLRVTYLPSGKTANVPPGTTLFNAAHWAGLPIESTCGGRGTCGKCRVRVAEGVHEPTPADHRKLGASDLADGWRLSCQLEIAEDTVCEVPNLQATPKAATMGVARFVLLEPNVRKVVVAVEPPSLEDARSHAGRLLDALEAEGLEPDLGPALLPRLAAAMRDEPAELTATIVGDHLVDVEAGTATEAMFGVSFDVGTTTVVATLVDLTSGSAAAVESTINRQAPFGADVIARMGHAMTGIRGDRRSPARGPRHGERSRRERVRDGRRPPRARLRGRRRRERDDAAPAARRRPALDRAVAVRRDVPRAAGPARVRTSGSRSTPRDGSRCFPRSAPTSAPTSSATSWRPASRARTPCGCSSTSGRTARSPCGSAERVVATAAPAGPAFEGGQILHGMRATDGAIEGVVLDDDGVHLQVIGGDVTPRGICGSGLIDVVAQLRLSGLLGENGVLVSAEEATLPGIRSPSASSTATACGPSRSPTTCCSRSSTSASSSPRRARSRPASRSRWTPSASAPQTSTRCCWPARSAPTSTPRARACVGLVPPVPVERIRAVGNTASEGAKMALASFREREIAFELPAFVEYLELSGAPDFNDRFIRNLAFPALASLERAG